MTAAERIEAMKSLFQWPLGPWLVIGGGGGGAIVGGVLSNLSKVSDPLVDGWARRAARPPETASQTLTGSQTQDG